MPVTAFPNGISSFGMPIVPFETSGVHFFVSSVLGSDGNNSGLNTTNPLATIAAAHTKATASRGDIINCMPFHVETVTSAITISKIGVLVRSMGWGNARATITSNGTIDTIDLTGANTGLVNIRFAAPETDAGTAHANLGAAGCQLINCEFIGSQTAKNMVKIITLEAGANDALIKGCRIFNSIVEVPNGIDLEGICSRVIIDNLIVHDAIGFTNGCINDSATSLQLTVMNSILANAKADTIVAEFGNNTTGIMSHCFWNGRHTTIQSAITTGTGMAFNECYGVEEAQKNGLYIPVQDAD